MEGNYSLSDLAAVTNGGEFGGNSIVTLLLLFALINGGMGWNRGGDYGQFATAASQQDILFGQKFSDLDNKMDRLGNGIADATFSLNNSIKDCCCSNKEATAQVRYDMSNFASQINSNIDNKFAALEKAQLEQTIAAQQNQINALNLAQQMCGVVKYPMASTWSMGGNPFCNCNTGCCNTNV